VNLKIFEFFALIYLQYRWPVLIQTIDKHTLHDHGIKSIIGKIDGLDLSNKADLSLFMLLKKIKIKFKSNPTPINIILDEGRCKPGQPFGSIIFHDWQKKFTGIYNSSAEEPLLQLADFLAFCINRSTHLSTKKKRTDIDNWFVELVGKMQIDCDDLKTVVLPVDFSVADLDQIHFQDRAKKGL